MLEGSPRQPDGVLLEQAEQPQSLTAPSSTVETQRRIAPLKTGIATRIVALTTSATLLFGGGPSFIESVSAAEPVSTPTASGQPRPEATKTPSSEEMNSEIANKFLENNPFLKNLSAEERVRVAQSDINAFRAILKDMLSDTNFSLEGKNSRWWQIIHDDTTMRMFYGGGVFRVTPPSERRISDREEEISYTIDQGRTGFLNVEVLYRDGKVASQKLILTYSEGGEIVRIPSGEIPPGSLQQHSEDLFDMPEGVHYTIDSSTLSNLPAYRDKNQPKGIQVIGRAIDLNGTRYRTVVNNGGLAESSIVHRMASLSEQYPVAQ